MDLDLANMDWYIKIDFLYTDLLNASITNFQQEKNISINKQFILFKDKS